MELWEFYICKKAFNEKQKDIAKEQKAICWQTGYFAGAAFNGKLKNLKEYLGGGEVSAPTVSSKSEFDEKLKLAEEGGL